jgi:hydrogenase maturation protein HypF
MRQRLKLHIKGVVQGVGFRPYIYNLSRRFSLGGFTLNDSRGVIVEIEGEIKNVQEFLKTIKNSPPPASHINSIHAKRIALKGQDKFSIKPSLKRQKKFTLISYDLAICADCRRELFTKHNRRYLYPFINCTNCGPRFTIIKDMPYDRANTTMDVFKMCEYCFKEYNNRHERRFHAEPNVCFACGPTLSFFKKTAIYHTEHPLTNTNNIFKKAAELIYKGKILAIKGIGGYHLACDAKNTAAVTKLRKRKQRPTKPFALMIGDMKATEEICFLSSKEKELISSSRRPIALLEIKRKLPWIRQVAPQQKHLGVMLAYAPLHYILFYYLKKCDKTSVLVMTSANKKDFPLVSEEKELWQLKSYADYFLTHNRNIYMRCDDSISRIFQNKEIIVRKARGYTPDFVEFKHKKHILGCGAELKNTFSIAKNNYLITSPYIGDLKNYRNYELFFENLSHYQKVFNFQSQAVAYDYHPEYLSTQYALTIKGAQKIAVQHHHAHLAACLFENNINEKAIGVCFDGTGLGLDNAAWGGEFFIVDKKSFTRLGHFRYFGLLGHDKAIEEPKRVVFYLLHQLKKEMPKNDADCRKTFTGKERNIFQQLIESKEFTLSSSAGRLFDAVSGILGLCDKVTYEAEAAILLEMLAMDYKGASVSFDFSIDKKGDTYIIDWQPLFAGLFKEKSSPAYIAYKFHFTLARIIQEMAKILRKNYSLNKVVLSGGVFQNMLLLKLAVGLLVKEKFSVYYHHRYPFNDGAISIGQVVVANENI